MNEKIEAAQRSLEAKLAQLTEALTARFSAVDAKVVDKEKDTLIEEFRALQAVVAELKKPKIRKMAWAGSELAKEAGTEVHGFSRFMRAVIQGDREFLREMRASSGQSEGTNADGGYAVPVEYANEIIRLERQSSVLRSIARVIGMGSKTRDIPRGLADPTVAVVAEGTEVTLTKGTLDHVVQTAKKFIAIIPFSSEILEDNDAAFDAYIAERVALGFGQKEDYYGLVGDSGDPFTGVFFASGVNAVSLVGDDVSVDDVINLMMAPKAPYRNRGKFVLATSALKKVMKLKDDNNNLIWTSPEGGAPGRILGKPYEETDQIPDTLGASANDTGTNTGIAFGAWDGLWISPRAGYTVSSSDSASDSSGKSAFTLDEIWTKFRRRGSVDVVNPEAFGILKLPAA